MLQSHRAVIASVLGLAIAPAAFPDWSTDPSANTPVAVAPNDTVEPKVVALPGPTGEGCYVSWYDNRGGGYDVYLQRFDRMGNPLWAANGIQIADTTFSSVEDYGLAADASGHAVLAFRDTRFGGTSAPACTVTRVSPDGVQVWGPNGKQVTLPGVGANKPEVCVASDGDIVAAWIQGSGTAMQRLSPEGTLRWATPKLLTATGSLFTTDIQPSGATGSVIVSLLSYTTFTGPKTLRCMKVNADGTNAWPALVPVFTTGSLQFGNFPSFVPNNDGGAFFAWYTTSPLQVFAQRISGSGAPMWGTNGIAVATTAGRDRTSPSLALEPATGQLLVAWVEELPPPQNGTSCRAQLFDSAGTRLWTNAGAEVTPMTASYDTQDVVAQWFDYKPTVVQSTYSSFNSAVLSARQFSLKGKPTWTTVVCNHPTAHSDTACAAVNESLVVVWEDPRNDSNDLYGGAVNTDGTLGPPPTEGDPADLNGDGVVNAADLAILLGAWGPASPGTPADINGDGEVNAADLTILLSSWS
jgi:hypothetical protein